MMITRETDRGYFQLRAAAICLRDGHVLIHRALGAQVWSLPGGRVDLGEHSATTIVREMAEELHTTAHIERLVATIELTDVDPDGRVFHEVALYYAMQLPDLVRTPEPFRGPETSVPVEFFWCPLGALPDYNLVPASIRALIADMPAHYRHITVQQQDYAIVNETHIRATAYDILS